MMRNSLNSQLNLSLRKVLLALILSGAKVLQRLDVDLEIVAIALKIAVWVEIDHLPYEIAHIDS
jgi:hypothetical protein